MGAPENGTAALGAGPLWFVLCLLLFSAGYAAWGSLRAGAAPPAPRPFPGHGAIAHFAAGLRHALAVPVGWTIPLTSIQPAHQILYVASFALLGVVAVAATYAVSDLVRRLPGARRVL